LMVAHLEWPDMVNLGVSRLQWPGESLLFEFNVLRIAE